jgi:hypothetical protein
VTRPDSARVARAHDENLAFTELRWHPVFGGVELRNHAIELAREGRLARDLIRAGGDHDLISTYLRTICGRDKLVALACQRVHLDPETNRKTKTLGVGLHIVGNLVLGWVGVR